MQYDGYHGEDTIPAALVNEARRLTEWYAADPATNDREDNLVFMELRPCSHDEDVAAGNVANNHPDWSPSFVLATESIDHNLGERHESMQVARMVGVGEDRRLHTLMENIDGVVRYWSIYADNTTEGSLVKP